MPGKRKAPKAAAATRRSGENRITVWLLPEEKALIQRKAKAHDLKDSAYLRTLGLNLPIKSTVDQAAVLELARVNGDLGRLGGLLKRWLTNQDRAMDLERLESLLDKIEATQEQLARTADTLLGKRGPGGRRP